MGLLLKRSRLGKLGRVLEAVELIHERSKKYVNNQIIIPGVSILFKEFFLTPSVYLRNLP